MTLIYKKTNNTEPLINALGTDSPSICTNSAWIIDSGATNHVSKNPSIVNRYNSKYSFLELSNGGHAEIKSTGSMKLGNEMSIDNMLSPKI